MNDNLNPIPAPKPSHRFRTFSAVVVILGTVLAGLIAAGPASATASMTGPTIFYCNSASKTLQLAAPKVVASTGGPEGVYWANEVWQWNYSTRVWAKYQTYVNMNTVNSFGQAIGAYSWVGLGGSTPSGSYINSYLNLRVTPGTYAIRTVVVGDRGGAYLNYWVANGGNCTVS